MFIENVDESKLIEFAEMEFGKVTTLSKLKSKNYGSTFYKMTFNRRTDGAYEEVYFYDFEVFPLRFDNIQEKKKLDAINKRYTDFIQNNLNKGMNRDVYAMDLKTYKASRKNNNLNSFNIM